jgi:hypothetical protein
MGRKGKGRNKNAPQAFATASRTSTTTAAPSGNSPALCLARCSFHDVVARTLTQFSFTNARITALKSS